MRLALGKPSMFCLDNLERFVLTVFQWLPGRSVVVCCYHAQAFSWFLILFIKARFPLQEVDVQFVATGISLYRVSDEYVLH